MKPLIKYYLLFLLCSVSFISAAQEEAENENRPIIEEYPPLKKQYYLFSPRVAITVPHPMSNNAFRKSFVGVYEASVGLNIMLYKGIFAGLVYKNGLLKITENKIPDYEANMYINNAGVKIGGDKYMGEKNRVITSVAVTVGQNQTHYSSLKCKDPKKSPMINGYSTTYVEPEISLFFLVESNFGIGANVSYSLFNKNFDPHELCLNDWAHFEKSNPGTIQYLSFGFGFYYSFLKKKKNGKITVE